MSEPFNINEDAQSAGEFSGSQSSVNDSQPTESAFPDEDEETITMLDVIEREDELEEEASAVLGNSDEKNCTYPKVGNIDLIFERFLFRIITNPHTIIYYPSK